MGTMSASDAAPLPRLGEVFFDVRGNSRSMRLSWYADTGVAVLSIWQGGMCTGTFRLAIGDLPRMVETLQRGPGGPQTGWDSEPSGQAFADAPMQSAQVHTMGPPPGHGPPDPQAGPGDYLTGVREYLTEPPDHPASPPEYRPEMPDDLSTGSTQYRTGPAEYLTAPPDHRAGPGHRAGPPDYLTGPPDHRASSPDYLTGPPDHRAGPPDYLTGAPEYLTGPPDHRTEYPADRPAPGSAEAGYGAALYVGRRDDAPYPGPDNSAAYPHNTGGQVRYQGQPADDLYPGGTGPMDYQGEPSLPHYQPGTSAPPRGDALGRSTADYPAHYGTAVTDDIGHEPAQDSFPYRRPQSGHGGPNRRADPDASFD